MGKMRQLRRALRSAVGHPVAYQIQDGRGASLRGVLESVIRGERVTDHDLAFALADDEVAAEQRAEMAAALAAPLLIPAGKGGKATALVSARGLALYDVELQPLAYSTLLLGQTITQLANDPEVGMIVIEHDSPGGVATGVPEAADAIFNARKTTKVVSIVNPLSASASYWLASQANEVIAVPSADIGSIGVFMMHAECSKMIDAQGIGVTFIFAGKFKTEGNPFEPLTEEARDFYQSQVNSIYGDFLKAVARGRGVSVQDVRDNFGQGRTFMADQAKRVGMIDRVMPLNSAMQRVGVSLETLEANRRGRRIEAQDRAETYERALAAGWLTPEEMEKADKIDVPMSDGRGEPGPDNAPQFVETREYADENTTQWEINKVPDAEAFKAQQREAAETAKATATPILCSKWDDQVYIDNDWPERTLISEELANTSPHITVDRDFARVYFKVANGSAEYYIEETSDDGLTWTLERVASKYAAIDRPIEDQPEAEADKPAHNPRHRRLALLRA